MGASSEQALPTVTDSAEGECGAIAFEIVNEEAYADFLALDPETNKLILESSDRSNVGQHSVQVKAYLVEHPNVELPIAITVTVNPC